MLAIVGEEDEMAMWENAVTNDALGAGNAYREALKVNANFYPAQTALDWLTRDGG